uniref:Putative tnf receptor-associated factor 6 n=1 Tax=Ixodes ricinus TaxID=34613 RepID=V5HC39_IXORI
MPPTCVPLSTEFIPGLDWRPLCFEHPLPLDKVCQVCAVLCKETVVLPCSHTLCDVCFESSVNLGCVCPLDAANFDKDAVDKLRLRPGQLLKLSVSCWNAEHGCNFIGPVSELLDHFEKECSHHRASCPKCHQDVPRMGLVQHCVRDCDPTQGAEAPQPRVTLQGVQLREGLEKASAEIKQSITELKDSYYGLQASVNTVTDDLKHGPSSSIDSVSSRLAQLQRMQSDAIHREGELLEDLRRSCADIKQTVSDLKNDFSRPQTSSGASKDDVKLGHSGKSEFLSRGAPCEVSKDSQSMEQTQGALEKPRELTPMELRIRRREIMALIESSGSR